MLDDPLHDTEVVQHLYEGNKKDDGAQNTSEEPVLVDGVLVEEEGCADLGLPQEVGGKESKPFEDSEASIGLEDEQGDSLLEEETDNDSLPTNGFRSRSQIISTNQNRRSERTHHGTWERRWEVNQKQNWKTKRPRTEMARSPYVVPCNKGVGITSPT
jgi:hypothetical protein